MAEVELFGVQDGKAVFLGLVKEPPEMKARDILRDYGFTDFDDDMSQDASALYAMQDLIAYCKEYYEGHRMKIDK